jgi:hypothetical protein
MAGTAAPTEKNPSKRSRFKIRSPPLLQRSVQTQQKLTQTQSINTPTKSGRLAFRRQCNRCSGVGPCFGELSFELPNLRRHFALRWRRLCCLRLLLRVSLTRGFSKRSSGTTALGT